MLAAQSSGPRVLTFSSAVDGSEQPYALYVPPDYDPSRKYPLVVSLHGPGSNHRLNMRRVFGLGNQLGGTIAEAARPFPRLPDVDFLVASPLARGTMGYQGPAEKDIYDVLEDVKRRYAVDADRVYLTGLSMGGGGALWLALTRPDVWAAVAAVAPAAPEGSEELAANGRGLPVHLYHGEADPIVPAARSRHWQKRLLAGGAQVQYAEYPRVRHNAWDIAYRNAAVFEWLGQFRRNPAPDRVTYATRWYKYPGAYWLRLDSLTPGRLASADALFAGPNRIEVTVDKADGLTLLLEGHPKFTLGKPLQVVINGQLLTIAKPGGSASFVATPKGWRSGRARPAPDEKRPGLEGPIAEAVASRHVYVYGTLDNPGPGELEARRKIALQAAEWGSNLFPKLLLSPRILADFEVSPEELREANLILFGTAATNRIIAQHSASWPLSLSPGAADYGLLFVAPLGDRLALVNSGLPWWSGPESARAGAFYLPWRYRLLRSFGDYILFRGSLDNVLAEGYFDAGWRLPDPAAISASGAVATRISPAASNPRAAQ